MITIHKTDRSGIYIIEESGHFWIQDDNGREDYLGYFE